MSCRCIDCAHYVSGHKIVGNTVILTYHCTKNIVNIRSYLSLYADRECSDFMECEPE